MTQHEEKNTIPPDVFPAPVDLGDRDWGTETLLGLVPGRFSLKRLFVRAGHKGGLQYHHLKNEVQILISGRMIIRTSSDDGSLVEHEINAGDVVHFSPGLIHQEEAITDCVLIEASTPHFNDRVRVEEQFGLLSNGGLPSTTIDEVIEK
jgi:mannose-6-phosphate isomerase-like protein (cupin superfamily)